MSVFDLCDRVAAKNPHAQEIISAIAESLADIIRNLHQHNIRHGDPHAGNFLVRSPLPEINQLTAESVSHMIFTLIDLDKTHYSDNEKSWRKKLYDIRCIRRFYVHNIDSMKCLEYYLERKPRIVEKLILKFWLKGGFNIYKWLKVSTKRN